MMLGRRALVGLSSLSQAVLIAKEENNLACEKSKRPFTRPQRNLKTPRKIVKNLQTKAPEDLLDQALGELLEGDVVSFDKTVRFVAHEERPGKTKEDFFICCIYLWFFLWVF